MKKLTYSTYTVTQAEDGSNKITKSEGTTTIPDEDLDAFLPIAQAEAYNGEVTVEDVPDPVTEPTQLDQIEAQVTYTALMTDTLLEEV